MPGGPLGLRRVVAQGGRDDRSCAVESFSGWQETSGRAIVNRIRPKSPRALRSRMCDSVSAYGSAGATPTASSPRSAANRWSSAVVTRAFCRSGPVCSGRASAVRPGSRPRPRRRPSTSLGPEGPAVASLRSRRQPHRLQPSSGPCGRNRVAMSVSGRSVPLDGICRGCLQADEQQRRERHRAWDGTGPPHSPVLLTARAPRGLANAENELGILGHPSGVHGRIEGQLRLDLLDARQRRRMTRSMSSWISGRPGSPSR